MTHETLRDAKRRGRPYAVLLFPEELPDVAIIEVRDAHVVQDALIAHEYAWNGEAWTRHYEGNVALRVVLDEMRWLDSIGVAHAVALDGPEQAMSDSDKETAMVQAIRNDDPAIHPAVLRYLTAQFGQPEATPKAAMTTYMWRSADYECPGGDFRRGWLIGLNGGLLYLQIAHDAEISATDPRLSTMIDWCRLAGVQVYYRGEWITGPRVREGQARIQPVRGR